MIQQADLQNPTTLDSQEGGTDKRCSPQCDDVLFGRTRLAHNHPGNALYRQLIQKYRLHYQQATSFLEKGVFVTTILKQVEDAGGRFLRLNKRASCWQVVPQNQVRTKVAHALRNCMRQKRKNDKDFGASSRRIQKDLSTLNLDMLAGDEIEPVPIGSPLPTFGIAERKLLLRLFG